MSEGRPEHNNKLNEIGFEIRRIKQLNLSGKALIYDVKSLCECH